MILDTDLVLYLRKIIEVSDWLDLTAVIIEPGLARGINDDRTAFFVINDIPNFPCGTIALNRIDVLQTRLSLVQALASDIQVEAEQRDDFVRSLTIKGRGIKIDFRCAHPKIFEPKRIPKVLDKSKLQKCCELKISSELLTTIQKATSAMSADSFNIIADDQKVRIEVMDVNSDIFTYEVPDELVLYKEPFTLEFFAKLSLNVLKKSSGQSFQVYANKLMEVELNGLSVYIAAKVE